MLKENINMSVEVVSSDDNKNTYEIRRKWKEEKKKALVIELYPTISSIECYKSDLSTMHLINHSEELGWGEVRIVNLYSKIFDSKPSTSQLKDDVVNLSYVEEILEQENINTYDIVIAWGNSLSTHKTTIKMKIDLLNMLKDKELQKQVKCIITDNLSMIECYGVHPLYLGLRYAKNVWKLEDYPLDDELKKLESCLKSDTIKVTQKKIKNSKEKK